jgi:hypothetical protein
MPSTGGPADILMPRGTPVGVQGRSPGIREMPGGMPAAQKMFDELIKGASLYTPPNYPGTGYNLVGGGWVGLRPTSKSGPPTIDVSVPGIPLDKIKFKP